MSVDGIPEGITPVQPGQPGLPDPAQALREETMPVVQENGQALPATDLEAREDRQLEASRRRQIDLERQYLQNRREQQDQLQELEQEAFQEKRCWQAHRKRAICRPA